MKNTRSICSSTIYMSALVTALCSAGCETQTTPGPDGGDAAVTVDSRVVDAHVVDAHTVIDTQVSDTAVPDTMPPTFKIGGKVSGLTGSTLTIQNNAGDDLQITQDGNFSFETAVPNGSTYDVTVKENPTAPYHQCSVAAGKGTVANADVTTIIITCIVLDCTDTGTITADNLTKDIDTSGTSLFFLAGKDYGVFKIYDVSNPASPSSQGSLTLTNSTGCWNGASVKLAPGGNFAYLYGYGCNGLPVINVSNRAKPTGVSIVKGPSSGTMDATICGSTLYVATQSKGVAAYDISNPGAPIYRNEVIIAGSPYPYGVTCGTKDATSDYVYLGDGGSGISIAGLHIFEYNKQTFAFKARGAHTPTKDSWGGQGWLVSSTLLYLTWSNTGELALFDISNPDNLPAPTTFPGVGEVVTSIFIDGTHLFSSRHGIALGVYDVSKPTAPTLIYKKDFATSATLTGMNRFVVSGKPHLAYTLNGDSKIYLCKLINL